MTPAPKAKTRPSRSEPKPQKSASPIDILADFAGVRLRITRKDFRSAMQRCRLAFTSRDYTAALAEIDGTLMPFSEDVLMVNLIFRHLVADLASAERAAK